mmetsp:Transcript_24859/g.72824  ORF Transcript_24859/g.72824 Transcript_24859/m.72824 type:complete len:606 (-) Transcript_24859:317-2134(-)
MDHNDNEERVEPDASLVKSLASELTSHLSRGGARGDDGSEHSLDLDVRSALRSTVEQLMGRELDEASRRATRTSSRGGSGGGDTRTIAEDVSRTSQTFAAVREAVQHCARSAKLQSLSVGGQKKQRCIDESRGEADSNDADGPKSFSLFDMLDRQPMQMERVCADKIMEKYKEGTDSGVIDWNGIASLLEDVEDIEDVVTDPFSGSVWDEILKLLGIGLVRPEVSMRFAKIHSKFASMCEKSRNPAENSQQLCDLTMNSLNALLDAPLGSRTVGLAGEEVIAPGNLLSIIQSFHDTIFRLVSGLDFLMSDDLDLLLKQVMLLVSRSVNGPDASHVLPLMALHDPYADWFSMLLRELPASRVMPFLKKTGVVTELISRSRLCGCIPDISISEGKTTVACSRADMQHCFYIQSLSMLHRILELTDGNPNIFPYSCVSNTSSESGDHAVNTSGELSMLLHVRKVILPYQRTLMVGIDKGECCVDQGLARLCAATVETIVMGQVQKCDIFVELFSSFVDCLVPAIVKIGLDAYLAPSSAEFLRVCRNIIVYSRPQRRNEDVAAGGIVLFPRSARLLESLVDIMVKPSYRQSCGLDTSILNDIKTALESM